MNRCPAHKASRQTPISIPSPTLFTTLLIPYHLTQPLSPSPSPSANKIHPNPKLPPRPPFSVHLFTLTLASRLASSPMESQLHVPTDESSSSWTDEKHLHFLNTMEASFVRAMFQNDARYTNHTPRLDRYLPDTSDSTLDLKPHRTSKKHSPSGLMSRRGRMEGRRIRKRTSQPYNSSHDQVVPQVGNVREGDGAADTVDDKEQQR